MTKLRKLGKESHRRTFIRHGAPAETTFGVPIADLKPIQKAVGKDHRLALDLFATGNSDAMYLAGLVADEARMTRTDLNRWAREATWSMISTCTVAWVAAESPHAMALATKWIDARRERVAATGWSTLSSHAGITPDDGMDLSLFEDLLERVVAEIHDERNEVKDTMNRFVIAVGCFVAPLKSKALKAAKTIGSVDVDQGDTSCKTPDAAEYIRKVASMGRTGKKRKSARC
ncbi:MAG: DNA alkylation repair protein [Akkermansiaceae bacterium]|nr:DNA alkylation repair protein [Akkermansiaceae bacterium]NNM27891.1 DNA alkylation repair protein [Akkermansiaceae bacterium]